MFRFACCFFSLLALLGRLSGQPGPVLSKNAVVYVVRHAEKEQGKDPDLTAAGRQRAGDLYRELAKKGIQRIYVSGYNRTRQTADSLRIYQKIPVIEYQADTSCTDLFARINSVGDADRAILVISHSNIVPRIIYKLGIIDFPQEYLPETEFDNLYEVKQVKGKAVLTHKKYGAASGVSADMR